MAHSRVERVGTIFSRFTALWENGAITEDKLPLWYDVYKAFPPKYEPKYDRPSSQAPIRNIFYKEDVIRAQFHKDVALQAVDLKSKATTRTQLFLNICNSLNQFQVGLEDKEVYNKALQIYTTAFQKSIKSDTGKREPDNRATN